MPNLKKTCPEPSRRIVCLGGGNAMPKAVLAGLKTYPEVELSVVSAMLDSGGSAGEERKKYKTGISFGDIRRAFYVLSKAPKKEKDAWNLRIQDGNKTFVVSNLTSSTIVHQINDPEMAIDFLNKVFMIPKRYEVLPATLDDADIYAELEDGTLVISETKIDIPERARPKIKRVYLEPKATAYPKVVEAIKSAELITIGPGDLYSSLAQILLTEGIPQAIKESIGKIVYIANTMTKSGETDNFSISDLTNEIEKYLGGSLDYVIYNSSIPSKERIEETKKENPRLVDLVKINDNLPKEKFIGADLLSPSGLVVHDPQKLAKIIIELCKQSS